MRLNEVELAELRALSAECDALLSEEDELNAERVWGDVDIRGQSASLAVAKEALLVKVNAFRKKIMKGIEDEMKENPPKDDYEWNDAQWFLAAWSSPVMDLSEIDDFPVEP